MSKLLSRRAFSGFAAGTALGAGWPTQGALAASPSLKDYGRAPEFAGIDKWLNSGPLTMQGLAGKVVLVDFWTYTCINCIRTLPHVVRWYETYKDQGFVVVGVHSPEFAYERSTRNVQDAIERFNIRYPVAQDNSFTTWKAYGNQYWPAFYLVDSKGQVMRQHFGEGEYAEMEAAIQALLAKKAVG
jgi:thiol-disulfide isomerase/thioredoxin